MTSFRFDSSCRPTALPRWTRPHRSYFTLPLLRTLHEGSEATITNSRPTRYFCNFLASFCSLPRVHYITETSRHRHPIHLRISYSQHKFSTSSRLATIGDSTANMSAESETMNNKVEDTSMTSTPEKGKGKAIEQPDLSMAEEETSDEESGAENQVRSCPLSLHRKTTDCISFHCRS